MYLCTTLTATCHGNKNIQENLAKEFKSSTLGVESAKSSHISQDWLFNPIQTGGGVDATQGLNPLLFTNDCVYSVPTS